MAKIVFQRDQCIGCHACVDKAPTHWRMNDEDGKSELVGSAPKKGIFVRDVLVCDAPLHKSVVEHCPVRIIRYIE